MDGGGIVEFCDKVCYRILIKYYDWVFFLVIGFYGCGLELVKKIKICEKCLILYWYIIYFLLMFDDIDYFFLFGDKRYFV